MQKLIFFMFALVLTLTLGNICKATDDIVGGLSDKTIEIRTNFVGSNILIFGSIKRSNSKTPIKSDIIIEIIGPPAPIIVHKKKKKLGIWINSDPVKISGSPTFYALLSTENPALILTQNEIKKYSIGSYRIFDPHLSSENYSQAADATIRIRQKSGAYQFLYDSVKLKKDTLFSANVSLPSNLTEGNYEANIYLIQNKKIISSSTQVIQVRKIGLERWLYITAHEKPLFYGLFSIVLALISGWGASALFRRFQQ